MTKNKNIREYLEKYFVPEHIIILAEKIDNEEDVDKRHDLIKLYTKELIIFYNKNERS